MMLYLQEKFCMNPKNDLVKEWLKKSQHDLETAKVILAHKPELTDTICFHCQQAVEKTLKGYLVYLNIPFKRSSYKCPNDYSGSINYKEAKFKAAQ